MNRQTWRKNYMPVLEEAATTAVKTRSEEDYQFVLKMVENCYLNGNRFICPYEERDDDLSGLKRPVMQVLDKQFLLVFTSQEKALEFDCFKVMEAPVADVVHMVCELDEKEFSLEGIAINLHPGDNNKVPCIVWKSDLKKIDRNCKDIYLYFQHPVFQSMVLSGQFS